ncbi:MAG: hypothetical protein ACFFDN_44595, partial [Candidatus Hodarchaeota archaeon]
MNKINKLGTLVIVGILLVLMLAPTGIAPSDPDWNTAGNVADSSDFLGTTNNEDLRIYTNNGQKMVIKSDGKVGIGDTDPDLTLEIAGSLGSGYFGVSSAAANYGDIF